MATIKKRIGKDGKVSFHVRIRLKGYPLQCGTFPNITKAKEFVKITEVAIKEGRHFRGVESKKHTLADMIDRYIRDILPQKPKSYDKQKMQLLWWKSELGHHILSDFLRFPVIIIEKRDLLAGEKTNRSERRSPSTVIRYMAVLSHAFSIAVKEWGWLDDNPMRKISKPKEPRGRLRFLNHLEREKLLEVCRNSTHPYLYIIVILALSSGMRLSEIMSLKWKDIAFEHHRITLEDTKNGERRMVPLVGYAYELLIELYKKRRLDTLLLFPSYRNSQEPIPIRAAWDKAIQVSGIEDFRFHDLRHSFASEMAMDKATETELRILLGHKSHSMTARYSHLTEKHTSEIVRKMTDKIFSSESKELTSREAHDR